MFNFSPDKSSPEVFRKLFLVMAMTSVLVASGCGSDTATVDATAATDTTEPTDSTDTTVPDDSVDEVSDADFEPTDWTDETHSKSADPNFSEVFDDTQVKRLDFVITEERW